MNVVDTELPGVLLLEPEVFGDERGFFLEIYNEAALHAAGLEMFGAGGERLVQINHSRSGRDTVRGLHYQQPCAQGKLVWVASGAIFDVAVDVRRGSPTFGKWTGVELDDQRHKLIWVPPGFAHGFSVRTESADVMYACTAYYAPECQHAVRWDDPDIGIDWGVNEPILSPRDAAAPRLCDAAVLADDTGDSA